MTVVDVVVIFVIFLSALFSLIRGFVKEAISLATWIIAIWLAATFAPQLADALPGNIESEAVRQAVGFGVLFILTLMVGAIINMLVSQIVKKTGLSSADRIFGVVFGALRGGLIIIVFVVIGGMTPLPDMEWWKTSTLLPWFENTAMVVQEYVPDDLSSAYQPATTGQ
ncbi:MAG TPA: CvpA family protein [Gammaproteobacteria bacterium]|nr:CvpA family protein [Gammaproteobacteria bacterium]